MIIFLGCEIQHGDHAKIIFDFQFNDDNKRTDKSRHVSFGTEKECQHLRTIYFL
jgi:hypothetical protein